MLASVTKSGRDESGTTVTLPASSFGYATTTGLTHWRESMSNSASSEAAKAVVRRNTEEVQGNGDFKVFEELFADDFVDHTPQPNMTPTNLAHAASTGLFGRPSPTSTLSSIGRPPMVRS
jgi:hypothetical protein